MSHVPNLDAMSYDALIEFHCLHKRGSEWASLFPDEQYSVAGMSLSKAEEALAVYADNKALAILYRIRANIHRAQEQERFCEKIYKELPNFAKW